VVVDALSRRHVLFSKMEAQIVGYNNITKMYSQDPEFSSIFAKCQTKPQGGYCVNQGYLFKEGKLCICLSSHRKILIK